MFGALELWWRLGIFLAAGIGAGVANGIVGGGTFVTFPTLIAVGLPALQANLTTSVGVVPSYLGSLRLFRHQLGPHRSLLRFLAAPCVLGAALGCALLFEGSPSTFRLIVPWLIGAGTALFAASPFITRRLTDVDHDHPARRWLLGVGVFFIAVYGGYFGAGLGILLLAVLALALPLEVRELHGLRNALSLVINLCAAIIFLVHGDVDLEAVWMLLLGTLIGGWLGAMLISRLSPGLVRLLVITIGVVTTVKLATS